MNSAPSANEASAIETARKLIDLLVNDDYSGFMAAVDVTGHNKKPWVYDANELREKIDNHGCDLEFPDPRISVTSALDAEGDPWPKGPYRVTTFSDGVVRVHCQLPLNGEWTDLHIHFDFFQGCGDRPVVAFIGIP